MQSFDVIVVGLGAMGSAAVCQLSKRGVKVLGLDQYSPPHTLGSTHGETRITRQAIGEGSEYVPLVLRSNEIWRELEKNSGQSLFTITGGLIVGDPSSVESTHGTKNFLLQTIDVAKRFGISHEVLENEELKKRYPLFKFRDSEKGYYENGAGFLRPELCVEIQIGLAQKNGAELHMDEKVLEIKPEGAQVSIKTDKSEYKAGQLIVTAGPWISQLLPEFKDYFKVYRQVLYWFKVKDSMKKYLSSTLPVYIFDLGGGDDIYGFPMIDEDEGTLKLACEDYLVTMTPEQVNREVGADEVARMYDLASQHILGLSEECVRTSTCLYTVTPDSKFVIDRHPTFKQVIVASPCSGHGFKSSAAIGEVLAELATVGKSSIDISDFSLVRHYNVLTM
ncbi:N-methyl-L-tryptophan oxidase [Candidatus Peregrinibacteria bacterium]|nr:MAG: N-methyl-L-tryptophan oxidase [Candidatus Peregrinibacteria bacterium]